MNHTIVKVDLQFTKNLGNFENIKVSIGVEDNLRVIGGKEESVDEATNRVYNFVSSKLIDKVASITQELNQFGAGSKGK